MKARMIGAALMMLIGAALVSSPAGAETVEKIIAVIGDRVILSSELTNQVQMAMLSAGEQNDLDPNVVARDILQRMINDELILMAARDDTTITASDAEVQAGLDEQIASLASRFPSEDVFVEQLRKEGLTKRSLEKRYRPEIRDQILKQKIINRKLSGISVSRQETEEFYARLKDSLPQIPGKIRLAHIVVKFKVSPQTDDSVKRLADEARLQALDGKDLADIAASFVGRAPGVVGGRIGFIRRDEVVPEFGRAAFNLQAGEVSGLVKTEYGWHLIKCFTRFRDSVDVGQVLFPLASSAADSALTIKTADSLYRELKNGADFAEMAKRSSDDDSSRGVGGELPEMTFDQLRPEFLEPLSAIDTGQITSPILSQAGYHILKLLDREAGRPMEMDRDFDIIRNFARQEKISRMVDKWVMELKKNVYVDIRQPELR
jgi:peptidyl-prolyl cis-trans isomerase SurA